MVTTNKKAEGGCIKKGFQSALDLSRFRLSHSAKFHFLRDPDGNALLELRCDGKLIMAFLYRNFPDKALNWKRESIARQCCPLTLFPLTSEDAIKMIPLMEVDALPELEMWKICSTWGEDLFWCSDSLFMTIYPDGDDSCHIEFSVNSGAIIGNMRFSEYPSDHEKMLSLVLGLRNSFHSKKQVRIESFYGHHKVCWYIPARLN